MDPPCSALGAGPGQHVGSSVEGGRSRFGAKGCVVFVPPVCNRFRGSSGIVMGLIRWDLRFKGFGVCC